MTRLHELIVAQALRTPDAIAVSDAGDTLTYAQLLSAAQQVGDRLRQAGTGPDTIVAVTAQRSARLVASLLGILCADAAYLPMEPTWPEARVAHILSEAMPLAVLAGDPSRVAAGETPVAGLTAEGLPHVAPLSQRAAHGSDLAYVIYTSGSTGWPKGVGVPHAGVVNRLRWMQDEYQLGPDDVVLHKTPYTFDVSVWELFWPLLAGAKLVIAAPGGHHDPEYLAQTIQREAVTTVHFVPSMLAAFVEEKETKNCTSLKRVIASGEALSPALANRFRDVHPAELHNLYGPTEASIDVTHWRCRDVEPGPTVPIGRPIPGVRALVLDEAGNPVPDGELGELHLGGVCLARGYIGRPDLTRQQFVTIAGERLYRTGDLARCNEGVLEYHGRLDHQVKLRGQRIELGEIEHALAGEPGVSGAVVLLREDSGRPARLIGYVVVEPGIALDLPGLRRRVGARLPDYMVPQVLVPLAALPTTANGKCDRAALAAMPLPVRQQRGTDAARIA